MEINNFILPAEWEPQSAIQLTWPHAGTDWAPMLTDITATYVEMAREIADHEQLIIVSPCVAEVRKLLENELPAASVANIVFHECPTNDTWARDHGFITLKVKGDGDCVNQDYPPTTHEMPKTATTKLLDFCFNGWGDKFEADKDNAINRSLYDSGRVSGEYEDHLDFVLEGGSIESDGNGTVFTTSMCLLAPHRNQPLTQQQIEQRLKDYLRATRIIWLDHGSLIGDDTDGHIDTIVRLAPDDTLLFVGCNETEDEQYEDFCALEQQLRSLLTASGKPYRLLSLPMPDAIFDDDGSRLPATYANFLVTNEKVLVPVYGQKVNDEAAISTIASAFPGRKMIAIDSRPIIRQHGSIHCCTMQLPLGAVKD